MNTRIARCAKWALLSAALVVPAMCTATASAAEILVVSAHPDDDVVMAAGVIYRAVQRGESVRVVYVTNGDADGVPVGYTREVEAVESQSVLGVSEDRLMFLGYPDVNLQTVWDTATSPSSQYTSPNTGVSSTYGNRGLGHLDYHTFRHGAPAAYNHPNMVADMADVLATYLPTHIFVTSEFDAHTDHSTSYWILQEALTEVIASHPSYNPTIHKTQIWMSSLVWPNALDASAYFDEEPNLFERTGLVWAERESLDVPLPMQLTMYGNNPKYMAVDYHTSQEGAYQFLGRFVHKDEFYWTAQKTGTNAPPVPNAGFDQSVSEGTAVTLDGSASFDRNGDTVSLQWTQRDGTAVALSGATTAHPSFTAPAGLTRDALLTFELVVSDGTLTSVPDAVTVRVVAATQPPPPVNIAPQASSVTASSAADGQPPSAAVDGVVDGYPHDATREWSSDGQTTGAWIQLGWSSPHVVSSVRLHDRPNEDDQVAAGTLGFSDGSTVPVGRLPNPGAGLDVNFPSRTTTSLRFTIDAVVQASNIGLAEILVFEPAALCAGVTCTASDQCHVAGTCDPATGVCSNPSIANGSSCNDGNACTTGDTCGGGICNPGGPTNCDDSNTCTDDSCNPTSGCAHTDNTAPCSNGNACTSGDICGGGICNPGTPVVCNDNSICTTDTCDTATGCVYTSNTHPCSDGNPCTTGDVCSAGSCTGAPISCDDNIACTDDSCNPETGLCVHANNAAACDDDNDCTSNDVCANGVCAGTPDASDPLALDDTVRVDKFPNNATVSWTDPSGPYIYNVYRGGKGSSGPWQYNQSSLADQRGVQGDSVSDTDIPPPNHFFYYLITRVNATNCESPLGTDSSGLQRPNTAPSPMPPWDTDGDGAPDYRDNCPAVANQNQADEERDGVGDVCDNCAIVSNPDQSDMDYDGLGDSCDPDIDGDGILNDGDHSEVAGDHPCTGDNTADCDDNCLYSPNPDQADANNNGIGDACDDSARTPHR